MASVSFIIPTTGRSSLGRAVMSTGAREGDEVIVVPDINKSGGWGNMQRNEGIRRATCDYLSFMDDDDMYAPGTRDIIERAIAENLNECPILFRMQYPNGDVLWKEKKVVPGNVSTQMILVPNKKEMLGVFPGKRNMADFIFIDTWLWPKDKIIWREEVICLLGNNDGAAKIHN